MSPPPETWRAGVRPRWRPGRLADTAAVQGTLIDIMLLTVSSVALGPRGELGLDLALGGVVGLQQ